MIPLTLDQMWAAAPPEYKFAALNRNGLLCLYKLPERCGQPLVVLFRVAHNIPPDQWDKVVLERPTPIEVGMFGKFWDDKEESDRTAKWAYLGDIDAGSSTPYEDSYPCERWKHFRPGLPPERLEEKER